MIGVGALGVGLTTCAHKLRPSAWIAKNKNAVMSKGEQRNASAQAFSNIRVMVSPNSPKRVMPRSELGRLGGLIVQINGTFQLWKVQLDHFFRDILDFHQDPNPIGYWHRQLRVVPDSNNCVLRF